jgi:hypothetical protein
MKPDRMLKEVHTLQTAIHTIGENIAVLNHKTSALEEGLNILSHDLDIFTLEVKNNNKRIEHILSRMEERK